MLLPRVTQRSWRQINFRSTDSLLAAEFLHGLYQRHDPFLNPVRFSTTLVVFRPWAATSYAPRQEWDLLAARFGGRILRDPGRLLAELDRVLEHPRSRSRRMADQLRRLQLVELTDGQLADLLLESHHVPLGEIYEVNLVQVEHALHAALAEAVRQRAPLSDDDQGPVLAELLWTAERTSARDEEMAFLDFVRRCRNDGDLAPEAIEAELQRFADRFRALGAAYGATELTLDGVRHQFRQYLQLPMADLAARLRSEAGRRSDRSAQAAELLHDPTVRRLAEYSRRVGTVRDQNKRLLSDITRHRRGMLTEVAVRRKVDPVDVRLYLLEELQRLLETGTRVPGAVAARRLAEGVVLHRTESARPPGSLPTQPRPDGTAGKVMRGLCASPGRHRGRACLVSSASELTEMRLGDVMVARGTDFDLVPAMLLAGAIVTEEGGVLSHAAVLARERGIPCVVQVPEVAGRTPPGVEMIVDADHGRVEVLDGRIDRTRRTTAADQQARGLPSDLIDLRPSHPPERVGWKAANLARLAVQGWPVPELVGVLPVERCSQLWSDLQMGRRARLKAVASQLAELAGGDCLNFRSSSRFEDSEHGSAAGIYRSCIRVAGTSEEIATALEAVLSSGQAAAPADPIAVLVTRYEAFDFQGVANSRSPWSADHVLIEAFESDGEAGCPDHGGMMVEFHRDQFAHQPDDSLPHLWHDLRTVAETAVRLEADPFHRPVQVEWGLAEHRLRLLQARPVVDVVPAAGRPSAPPEHPAGAP